jgi:hypothetical protein
MNWSDAMLLALNPTTSISVLEELSLNQHYYVRYNVAQNPTTPTYILEKLAADPAYCVRYKAVIHKNSNDNIKNLADAVMFLYEEEEDLEEVDDL